MDEESARQCRKRGRHGFDPCVGRSPGGGNGNPLQYSCLEMSMGREAWQAVSSMGSNESDMTVHTRVFYLACFQGSPTMCAQTHVCLWETIL